MQHKCSIDATNTQHTCRMHTMHICSLSATYPQCSTHAMHMQPACNVHAPHMQYTCNTHSTHMTACSRTMGQCARMRSALPSVQQGLVPYITHYNILVITERRTRLGCRTRTDLGWGCTRHGPSTAAGGPHNRLAPVGTQTEEPVTTEPQSAALSAVQMSAAMVF